MAVVETKDGLFDHARMQQIAREFNFSETVFLNYKKEDGSVRINIFTPVNEMEFAGHPVIGTGHVLFRRLLPGLADVEPVPETFDIQIKAGTVTVRYDPDRKVVSAEVPHNVHVHSKNTTKQSLIDTQPVLASTSAVAAMRDGYPAVSIVKGVTYTLVDFTEQPDLFTAVSAAPCQVTELDEEWAPSFMGTFYYRLLDTYVEQGRRTQSLRVRMMAINLEDPACGSASCALAAYLALQHGEANGQYRFYLDQGREIGRDSDIIVDLTLNEKGDGVTTMFLSGEAALVTEGGMFLPE